MVVLRKITWKEFGKIVQILEDYKPIAMRVNHEDGLWFDCVLSIFSRVRNQPYNIEAGDLGKADFKRMTVVVDMWNVIKNSIEDTSRIPYDDECDEISSKLQRAYFKMFSERVFPGD